MDKDIRKIREIVIIYFLKMFSIQGLGQLILLILFFCKIDKYTIMMILCQNNKFLLQHFQNLSFLKLIFLLFHFLQLD